MPFGEWIPRLAPGVPAIDPRHRRGDRLSPTCSRRRTPPAID